MVVHLFHTKPANSWIVQPLSPVDLTMTVATLRAETILPATLERAACQPLLNAALEDATVNKPLLFFFLRELIWYYGDIVS